MSDQKNENKNTPPSSADDNQESAIGKKHWYVLHTYSGYEDNVARNLKQRIESMDMEDKILQVVVPREKKIKVKNGKRRTIEERLFPGL